MKLALSFALFAIALVQMTAAAPAPVEGDSGVEQNLKARIGLSYHLAWDYAGDDVDVEERAEQNLKARILSDTV
ncbi:uncharacterized protein EDB91DRAFT_1255752 [Suillus paluster]|uniref:uncharacterized protein n=1 Tax=Suillus paluster TaxID=48578 RepID=UPI001B86C66F|nr:uncharacterized protein EDB91DRAFT_1255752 [Suillus paluster]KAG1723195.1 hypothetical protein EDB91DRAFT_1255752 [Suillus paluster]